MGEFHCRDPLQSMQGGYAPDAGTSTNFMRTAKEEDTFHCHCQQCGNRWEGPVTRDEDELFRCPQCGSVQIAYDDDWTLDASKQAAKPPKTRIASVKVAPGVEVRWEEPVKTGAYDESQHPRDHGKFAPKGTPQSGGQPKPKKRKPDLLDEFSDAARERPFKMDDETDYSGSQGEWASDYGTRANLRTAGEEGEPIRELMNNYDAYRAKWVEEYGNSAGFDAWFTQQITGVDYLSEFDKATDRYPDLSDGDTIDAIISE